MTLSYTWDSTEESVSVRYLTVFAGVFCCRTPGIKSNLVFPYCSPHSAAPMFVPLFLLAQFILPFFFRFPPFTAYGFTLQFVLFMLQFQCLLCLCTNPWLLQLTVDLPLHPFRIYLPLLNSFGFDGWAKFHLAPIFEQEIPYLIVLWFRPKSNFTNLIPITVNTRVDPDPKWIFKEYRQGTSYHYKAFSSSENWVEKESNHSNSARYKRRCWSKIVRPTKGMSAYCCAYPSFFSADVKILFRSLRTRA